MNNNADGCVIDGLGVKRWFINGKLHRLDGPAVEWNNGTKLWYINGKLHRENGPAIEWHDGDKLWFVYGIQINKLKDLFG